MRHLLIAGVFIVALASRAAAQESKAAATTRKNLQQKVTLGVKEVGLKNFLESELNGELEKPLRFKIDNASGVSNNMKVTFSGKNVTVEKVLNELADKFDFGYYVISNAANNTVDGKIMIRKSSKGKERGYEAGKEPKKGAHLMPSGQPDRVPIRIDAMWQTLVAGVPCCYGPIGRIVTG
jgi:hypothetical protein